MHFAFALGLSDKRFVKCRFARSKICTFRFVCFQDVLKTSSRHVFKTSSRYVFKTSSRRLQRNNFSSSKTSWRRLQDVLRDVFKKTKTSWKTKNCYAEDVLKTCSRHVLKTSWRRLEYQQMFAGLITQCCWYLLYDATSE